MNITVEEWTKSLVGKKATADHPITCLNPEKVFEIKYVRTEIGHSMDIDGLECHVYVRGENTMWFHGKLVTVIEGE